MDEFFECLRGPSMLSKLPFEAKLVPCYQEPVLYLPISRLSFAADASVKGAVTYGFG